MHMEGYGSWAEAVNVGEYGEGGGGAEGGVGGGDGGVRSPHVSYTRHHRSSSLMMTFRVYMYIYI